MSLSDYALNLVLVALVIRQVRGKKLTFLGLAWPVALVVIAAIEYLRGIPTVGNGLALTLSGAAVGGLLGVACGALTRIVRLPDGSLLARATAAAAALWVVGVGARMGFGLYAEDGGGPAVARFSAAHHITATAWTACLILMALAEVLGRTAVLAARGHALAVQR